MRVLVVSNLYPPDVLGGYEVSCAQTADALAARGHQVEVFTSAPAAPDPAPVAGGVAVHRVLPLAPVYDVERVRGRSVPALAALEARSQLVDLHAGEAVVAAVARFQPDVVSVWNLIGVGGLAILGALESLGVPWVWHLGDRSPAQLCSERGRTVPGLAALLERTRHGRSVAVSAHLLEELDLLGLPRLGDERIVPNAAVVDGVSPVLSGPVEGRPLRVAYAGQVMAAKGADLAVAAVGVLRAEGREVELDLWGEVMEPEIVEAAGAGVRFHGYVDRTTSLAAVAQADVLVFPTWAREPFGLVGAEAAAVGTPPIISADCGLAEWLVDGVHCLKVDRSVDGVADALRRVLDGDVDLAGLARRGLALTREALSPAAVFARVEAILEEAAASGGASVSPRAVERTRALASLADRLVESVTDQRFA